MSIDLAYQLNPAQFLIPTQCVCAKRPDHAFATPGVSILREPGVNVLMRVRNAFLGILLLGAASAMRRPCCACAAQQMVDRIVARIEDDIITQSEVRELAAYQQLIDGQAESDDRLLSELIEQWVVNNEATAAHFPRRRLRSESRNCANPRSLPEPASVQRAPGRAGADARTP